MENEKIKCKNCGMTLEKNKLKCPKCNKINFKSDKFFAIISISIIVLELFGNYINTIISYIQMTNKVKNSVFKN